MLSNGDLERLIAKKRREIEKEKIILGLSVVSDTCHLQDEEDERIEKNTRNGERKVPGSQKSVRVKESGVSEDVQTQEKERQSIEAEIPPELDRYIRRYLGLPVMLKAGEYSPNNPLVRAEPRGGANDVLLGLGEYERRQHTLRRIRQQQYREYLDQQAKKKQEEKEKAERERREREEKERLREEELERTRKLIDQQNLEAEQKRCRQIEQQNKETGQSRLRQVERSGEQRRSEEDKEEKRRCVLERNGEERRSSVCYVPTGTSHGSSGSRTTVDTGVQVEISSPLSVAVQTDDLELYRLCHSPTKLTQAERELSPRTVGGAGGAGGGGGDGRRRSCSDYDPLPARRTPYMPTIFDADAIHNRNLQAEKEALERRQYYQQELKNQIQEQQRIREERRSREKLLEAAEMRRLEEQLRVLRAARGAETARQQHIEHRMRESASEFERKRTTLQREIDTHDKRLLALPRTPRDVTLPENSKKLPFSTNIPENSIFNPDYDVDSYLRKNLNPKNVFTPKFDSPEHDRNVVVEKALIHASPKERPRLEKSKYEPSFMKSLDDNDDTPIPVLRHSPVVSSDNDVVESKNSKNTSKEMKKIEDKWKVPVVQKNILKNIPKENGKNVSILTQLGSIRRQLQMEQLRLDNLSKRN